jgi:hypothetical protein
LVGPAETLQVGGFIQVGGLFRQADEPAAGKLIVEALQRGVQRVVGKAIARGSSIIPVVEPIKVRRVKFSQSPQLVE